MRVSASSPMDSACPLCSSKGASPYSRDRDRQFLRCGCCGLVFVPSSQFLSREDERKRYDLHRNFSGDEGYRRFLRRLFMPLHACLVQGSGGLDFGCGPEPLLARMFRDAGHRMATYDPFYAPDTAVLEERYDFITATEVAEHLRQPGRELGRLWSCLRPGGVLGIMTRPPVSQDAFPAWQYKNDRTHVCFFSGETFRWLAATWDAMVAFPESDIVLFRKKRADDHGNDRSLATP